MDSYDRLEGKLDLPSPARFSERAFSIALWERRIFDYRNFGVEWLHFAIKEYTA